MVAEVEQQVVGFVSFGPTRTPALPYSGEVYALYVAIDWQGQGLGRRLLATALEALAKEGHRGAMVWVLAANPARFFYEAMGGERAGERLESFAGTELEELAYGWPDLDSWLAQMKASCRDNARVTQRDEKTAERKGVVEGQSVSVRIDLGG